MPSCARRLMRAEWIFTPDDEETPEAARALLKREVKLWGDVIRANHIAAQ